MSARHIFFRYASFAAAEVGEDRRGDHAETDLEEALVRHLVLGLETVEDALVGGSEARAAVFGRAGDPAETGIELLAAPCL